MGDRKEYLKQYHKENRVKEREKNLEWKQNNREKNRELARESYKRNKEKIATKSKERYKSTEVKEKKKEIWKDWYSNPDNKEKAKQKAKAHTEKMKHDPIWLANKREKTNVGRLKKLYKLTPEQLEEKIQNQNNRCAICNEVETARDRMGKEKRLSVDHCHSTGKVRGMLCTRCNSGLGHFKDNIEVLGNAIQYLIKHKGEDEEYNLWNELNNNQ